VTSGGIKPDYTSFEQFEVDGMEGDDRFLVRGTRPGS
jgi:hypothetical protein